MRALRRAVYDAPVTTQNADAEFFIREEGESREHIRNTLGQAERQMGRKAGAPGSGDRKDIFLECGKLPLIMQYLSIVVFSGTQAASAFEFFLLWRSVCCA